MQRALRTAILAGFATVALSTGAQAAGNSNAKIMLHALPTTTKNPCTRVQNVPTAGCPGYDAGIDNKALYPTYHYAYLLVVNGSQVEGVAGVQFGITYDGPGAADLAGVDIFGWSLCATLEFQSPSPAWPNSGCGNLVTWDAVTRCQTSGSPALGTVAVGGYFYLGAYAPAIMRVTPRPVDGLAKVANCGSVEDIVFTTPNDAQTFLGAVGFGQPGINPCGRDLPPLAVTPSSWSGVKNLIRS